MGGQPEYSTYGGPKRKNALGIVGFVFSVTCLLAPLGLLLSVVALLKGPRGFAIAGTIVGAVFSIPHGFVAFSAYQWATMSPGEIVAATTTTETGTVIFAVERHIAQTGNAPDSLDNLGLGESSLTDFWGTPYRYDPGAAGNNDWTLSSAGPDKQFGTADDLDDLLGFAANRDRQQEFSASFDQSIDVDQFDRDAAKEDLGEATMEMFRTMIGRSGSSSSGNAAPTGADGRPADPADTPDTPDTPETPESP